MPGGGAGDRQAHRADRAPPGDAQGAAGGVGRLRRGYARRRGYALLRCSSSSHRSSRLGAAAQRRVRGARRHLLRRRRTARSGARGRRSRATSTARPSGWRDRRTGRRSASACRSRSAARGRAARAGARPTRSSAGDVGADGTFHLKGAPARTPRDRHGAGDADGTFAAPGRADGTVSVRTSLGCGLASAACTARQVDPAAPAAGAPAAPVDGVVVRDHRPGADGGPRAARHRRPRSGGGTIARRLHVLRAALRPRPQAAPTTTRITFQTLLTEAPIRGGAWASTNAGRPPARRHARRGVARDVRRRGAARDVPRHAAGEASQRARAVLGRGSLLRGAAVRAVVPAEARGAVPATTLRLRAMAESLRRPPRDGGAPAMRRV